MGLCGDSILRNLDKENPLLARPQSVACIGAILPFILGGMCAFLASEATPQTPFSDNPLALFCIGLSIAASVSALMPKIFNWDWRTKYFGFSTVYLASASLLGVIPWLCIVLYSALPLWTRISLFFSYAAIVIWWCRRFVVFYRRAFADKTLRNIIYVEDCDAIYYSQKNDNWLIEKKFKLKQFPSNIVVFISLGLAFLLIPFVRSVKDLVGLPFPYTFLTIGSLPVIMMVLGLTVRGCLVFYYYPWKLKKETGKDVYVDMVTKTASLRIK
jgi:hypothetical protein